MRTVVGHSVKSRTRTPAVTFFGWDVLGPFASRSRATFRGNLAGSPLRSELVGERIADVHGQCLDIGNDSRYHSLEDSVYGFFVG